MGYCNCSRSGFAAAVLIFSTYLTPGDKNFSREPEIVRLRLLIDRSQTMTHTGTVPGASSFADERDEPVAGLPLDEVVMQQYDSEQLPLRRYLIFAGVDEATAQEIVQETFLRLYRHLGANGDRSNLRAWIYRVARNLARNHQASAQSRLSAPMDGVSADLLPAQDDSPESQLLSRERERRVRRAMERLSDAQRECLLLRAQGMRYREIAAVLNLSVSTVGENIQRGLDRLRNLL
jgi:RNA polymerase sigma-70 factor (ECF subfamily)